MSLPWLSYSTKDRVAQLVCDGLHIDSASSFRCCTFSARYLVYEAW